jgi:hypothetical protein
VGEIKWGGRVNAVAGVNREVVGSIAGDVGINRFSWVVIGDELVLSWPAVQKQPAEDLGYSTTDSPLFHSSPRISKFAVPRIAQAGHVGATKGI